MKKSTTRLRVSELRTNGGTQARERIDPETVDAYAAAMADGAEFPPPVAFFDGTVYWLADGFHRVASAKKNAVESIDVDVRSGDRRQAILFAVGANAVHGLRRTNADKRRAVTVLLSDDEWRQRSDRWIAEKCGVSNRFVGEFRATVNGTQLNPRTGQDGKTRKPPKTKSPRDSQEDAGEEPEVEPEVFDGDDAPMADTEKNDSAWGSFDVAQQVFRIAAACRESEERIRALYEGIDARFSTEVRARAQDSVLRLVRALDALLPPDGSRAEVNRAKFGVVTGGKGT